MLLILGMGGLGKTTLAKKVYNYQTVRRHFDCQAGISVSQSHNIEDLLRCMIKQCCEVKIKSPLLGMDSMDEESLILSSRNYLQQKRYVVVFDDIQKRDFQEDIKHVLPDNNKASRIIITTCKCEVINFCKKNLVLFMFIGYNHYLLRRHGSSFVKEHSEMTLEYITPQSQRNCLKRLLRNAMITTSNYFYSWSIINQT